MLTIAKMALSNMALRNAKSIFNCASRPCLINRMLKCTISCRKYHDLSKAGQIQSTVDNQSEEFNVNIILFITLILSVWYLSLMKLVSR